MTRSEHALLLLHKYTRRQVHKRFIYETASDNEGITWMSVAIAYDSIENPGRVSN